MSIKEYDKNEIDEFLSAEFSKDGEKVMEIMAVPNPRAYVLKGKQGKEAEIKAIKLEAYGEFEAKLKDIYTNDKRYDRPNAHTLVAVLFNTIDKVVDELESEL